MNKLAISLLLLGFLGCADSLSDGSTDDSPHFDLTKLRDGVWAVIARDGRHAGANSGIVNLGDGKSAIFDSSLTPEVGALLKEAADSLIGGSVFLVVNSNFESDHVRGNQVFAESSTIFGPTRTQQGISETEPIRLEFEREHVHEVLEGILERAGNATGDLEKKDLAIQRGYFEAVATSVNDVIPTTLTLVWDHKMNFTGEVRRIKIIPFGHAATESDAVLYLAADSLLFASDLLVVDRHPSMSSSNFEGWRAALDSLDLLPVLEVIPGHGPITDKSAIDLTRRYLDMIEQMANEIAAGMTTAAESTPEPPFDGFLRVEEFRKSLLAAVRSKAQAGQSAGERADDPDGL